MGTVHGSLCSSYKDWILFFDEVNALFGKRAAVGSQLSCNGSALAYCLSVNHLQREVIMASSAIRLYPA